MPTKPKTPQEQNANVVQGRDLFLTPNYATDIIINHLPYGIKNIWECASAGNKMSFRFKQRGFSVYESDIRLTSEKRFFAYNPNVEQICLISWRHNEREKNRRYSRKVSP